VGLTKTGPPIDLFPATNKYCYKWGLVIPVLDAMRHEPIFVDTVLPDALSGTKDEVISPSSVEI
jgi:hypothetical protein